MPRQSSSRRPHHSRAMARTYPAYNAKATGMSTGTKVAIGLGVVALVGGIGYYFYQQSQTQAAAGGTTTGGGGGGGTIGGAAASTELGAGGSETPLGGAATTGMPAAVATGTAADGGDDTLSDIGGIAGGFVPFAQPA